MDAPGRVLGRTLRAAWDDMFTLVLASGVWVLVAVVPAGLALVYGGPLLALGVLLVTLPPPTAGLYFLTNRLAHDHIAYTRHLLEGARRLAVPAWLLALFNVGVAILSFTNFQFYAQFDAPWMVLVRALWTVVVVVWAWSQLYIFPLLLEQEQPSLRLALRNSIVFAFTSPALTLTLTFVVVGLAAILTAFLRQALTFLPLLGLLPAFLALLSNVAVVQRLKALRGESDAPDAEA